MPKKVIEPVNLEKQSFVELKDDLPIEARIEVKFHEFNILLSKNFDEDTWINCLKALRESRGQKFQVAHVCLSIKHL